MYLLYLDGSGSPEVDAVHPNFVLLGLALPEGAWFDFEARVAELKAKYAFPGIPIELHCLAICNSIHEQNKIADFESFSYADRRAEVLAMRAERLAQPDVNRQNALRKYRETDPVVHLSRAERSKLYEEALDLVGAHPDIRLFAEVVNKDHLLRTTGHRNAIGPAFEQVLSRFDQLLQHVARGGVAHHGIAVIDSDPHSDLMRDVTLAFRSPGHPSGALQYVIETPFFVDSKTVSAIQLADVCGYALRRYVAKPDRAGSHEEKQLLRIFHKFDRVGARLHGVRHYCPARSCTCMICSARAHV